MASKVNKAQTANQAARYHQGITKTNSQFHQGLKVQPVRNPKLTAPTAYIANQGGKLQVKPASGKNYNPQGVQPAIGASYTTYGPK